MLYEKKQKDMTSSSSSSSIASEFIQSKSAKIICSILLITIIIITLLSLNNKFESYPARIYNTIDNISRRASQYAMAATRMSDSTYRMMYASRAVGMTECLSSFEHPDRLDKKLKGINQVVKDALAAEEEAAYNHQGGAAGAPLYEGTSGYEAMSAANNAAAANAVASMAPYPQMNVPAPMFDPILLPQMHMGGGGGPGGPSGGPGGPQDMNNGNGVVQYDGPITYEMPLSSIPTI